MERIDAVGSGAMKLRARIVVDIDAVNYLEAAQHQQKLESLLKEVRVRYATAQLHIRERRERKAHPAPEVQFAPRIVRATGRK
jgi:hypothetical protein